MVPAVWVSKPETVPFAVLAKAPEFVTAPVQVPSLLSVPAEVTLPIQLAPVLLLIVPALLATFPVHTPGALLVMVPVLVATPAL